VTKNELGRSRAALRDSPPLQAGLSQPPLCRAPEPHGYDRAPERGKPVYNFRSENCEFTDGRCLIIADGFSEFTAHTDPKSKRKHKWLFTLADGRWFCIAGIWRATEVGEAFTMLTTKRGPDVAPYHDRQVVVLNRADWARWLDPLGSAKAILAPLPLGTLRSNRSRDRHP
jgi:putative SOS response-associated peptidase YedK